MERIIDRTQPDIAVLEKAGFFVQRELNDEYEVVGIEAATWQGDWYDARDYFGADADMRAWLLELTTEEKNGLVLVIDIRKAEPWTGFGYKAEYALCMTQADGSFTEFWEKNDGYTEDDIEGVLRWAYELAEEN